MERSFTHPPVNRCAILAWGFPAAEGRRDWDGGRCGTLSEGTTGTCSIPIEVGDTEDRRCVTVEALVDTGATHSVMPRQALARRQVSPIDRIPFELAENRTVEYDVGVVRVRIDGRVRTAVVVFGPEGSPPLLGATTLELFKMGVDPVGQRLVPVPGLLKATASV